MKVCTKCGAHRTPSEFHADRSKPDGLHSHCKPCHSARKKLKRKTDPEWAALDKRRSAEFRKKHPERVRRGIRSATIQKKYGVSLEWLREQWERQDCRCLICSRPVAFQDDGKSDTKGFRVDHCHDTGKVRGLLCMKCNSGIGMLGDRPELLDRAAQYLRGEFSSDSCT